MRELVIEFICMYSNEDAAIVQARHDHSALRQREGETRFAFYRRFRESELARNLTDDQLVEQLLARFTTATMWIPFPSGAGGLHRLLHELRALDEQDAHRKVTVAALKWSGKKGYQAKGQDQKAQSKFPSPQKGKLPPGHTIKGKCH